jgi:hypothetical protein
MQFPSGPRYLNGREQRAADDCDHRCVAAALAWATAVMTLRRVSDDGVLEAI